MRYPFLNSPGHKTDYGQRTPFLPAHCEARVLFYLLPLVMLLTSPWLNASYVHAEDAGAAQKTTITVLPERTNEKTDRVDGTKQRARVKRLQLGIQEHEVKIRATQEKGQSLLAELERIERTLQTQSRKLLLLQENHSRQEELLVAEQNRLDMAIAEKQALQTYVQKRLTAYYQMGGIGLMNVIFSKKSLSELLSFQEYYQRMLQHDQVAITSYVTKIGELVQIRERHEREKNRLQELVAKVAAREAMLETTRREKTTLLNRVKTEERLYQQAVAEIQKAAADLTASLEERQRRESTQTVVLQPKSAKKPLLETQPRQLAAGLTFASLRGKLAPPVTGTVAPPQDLRHGQGDATSPFAGGIDIITTENQEIRAVFRGVVIASGYLRGYGNMIIIDHGEHYYSIVSRAGEILKEEGTTVHTGEVIGFTGDSGTLLGEGLHFEIRRGSTNEDPLLWLDRELVTFGD